MIHSLELSQDQYIWTELESIFFDVLNTLLMMYIYAKFYMITYIERAILRMACDTRIYPFSIFLWFTAFQNAGNNISPCDFLTGCTLIIIISKTARLNGLVDNDNYGWDNKKVSNNDALGCIWTIKAITDSRKYLVPADIQLYQGGI